MRNSYVTSGFAPLSSRIVQAITLRTSPIDEVAKVVGFEYSEVPQPICQPSQKNLILVVFVGGLTYMEIAAIRLIEKQNPDIEFVFMTTNVVNTNTVLKSLIDDMIPK